MANVVRNNKKKAVIEIDNSWMENSEQQGLPEGVIVYSVKEFLDEGFNLKLKVRANVNGKLYLPIYDEDKKFLASAYISKKLSPDIKAAQLLKHDEFQIMYVPKGTEWGSEKEPVESSFLMVIRPADGDQSWA